MKHKNEGSNENDDKEDRQRWWGTGMGEGGEEARDEAHCSNKVGMLIAILLMLFFNIPNMKGAHQY